MPLTCRSSKSLCRSLPASVLRTKRGRVCQACGIGVARGLTSKNELTVCFTSFRTSHLFFQTGLSDYLFPAHHRVALSSPGNSLGHSVRHAVRHRPCASLLVGNKLADVLHASAALTQGDRSPIRAELVFGVLFFYQDLC